MAGYGLDELDNNLDAARSKLEEFRSSSLPSAGENHPVLRLTTTLFEVVESLYLAVNQIREMTLPFESKKSDKKY